MKHLRNLIVGLDFDGTCVTHEFPKIGRELPECVSTLLRLQQHGAKIVLNTMRSDRADGKYLTDAVNWLSERGIELFGVNLNPEQNEWTSSPKVYAHLYIDDAALGAPLMKFQDCDRLAIDWQEVGRLLFTDTPTF